MRQKIESTRIEEVVNKYKTAWGGGEIDFAVSESYYPLRVHLKSGLRFLVIGTFEEWADAFGRAKYAKYKIVTSTPYVYLFAKPLKQQTENRINGRITKFNEIYYFFKAEQVKLWTNDRWFTENIPSEHQFL